jgi:hypothetical protein
MKRFYHFVYIDYFHWKYGTAYWNGFLFVGVSFRDNKGQKVTSKNKLFDDHSNLISTSTSLVFGSETDTSDGWISIGGPIKGSYLVKEGEDVRFDYISDFGMRVEDPCQAFDNKLSINLNPANRTVKDLKYHDGADSIFWLTNIC